MKSTSESMFLALGVVDLFSLGARIRFVYGTESRTYRSAAKLLDDLFSAIEGRLAAAAKATPPTWKSLTLPSTPPMRARAVSQTRLVANVRWGREFSKRLHGGP
jgi:hypothetical protein